MQRSFALLAAVGLVASLALLPGVVAAETLVGGSVSVGPDETVGDTSAAGGTVVVEGTVDGDLRVYGGSVRIADGGEVTGIVRAYGGSVAIDGTVGGNALAYGRSVSVGETGDVERSFGAVAGDVALAGRVGGDASAIAGSVTLAETASVEGNLNHLGGLEDRGGAVEGAIQDGRDLALGPPTEILAAVVGVALFVGDLLLGFALLWAAPRFADSATETVRTEPAYTVGVGLAATVGVGLAVVALAVTIVGLPLAVGAFLAALVVGWVARVYGQYVVGAIALSHTDREGRPLALLVGVVGVTLLGFVPYLGTLVSVAVFGAGAGVVALGASSLWRLASKRRGGLADL